MTSQQVRSVPAPGAGAAGPPPRSRRRWARLLRRPERSPVPRPPLSALLCSVAAMAGVSERTLQLSVLLAFASGVLVGWQANRLRRRYLDWRKRRLQDQLAVMQKKLDLA